MTNRIVDMAARTLALGFASALAAACSTSTSAADGEEIKRAATTAAIAAPSAQPVATAASAKPGDVEPGWLEQVSERMRAGQYRLREEQASGEIHATNRAHELQAKLARDGAVRVALDARAAADEAALEQDLAQAPSAVERARKQLIEPEPTSDVRGPELSLRVVAIARGPQRVAADGGAFALAGCQSNNAIDETGACLQRAERKQAGVTEWWENRPEGLEQGFDVASAPFAGDASAPLRVELQVQGARVVLDADGQGATFELAAKDTLRYDRLAAFDAGGKALPISLVAYEGGLAIEVDERGARYPIMIDPLLSSASWVGEGQQDNARLGSSVASAGDVNNDGFGDVIVGAPLFDNNQTNEGRAFIFHGSATGLGTVAARTLESTFADAWFGYSVASAGDVNNDGFGDVIVGAPHTSNGQTNEGRAYIYHGSASGVSSTPARTLETNMAGANFGASVAGAGLINNDQFGDVVVGAVGYANGQSGEGATYVYHGGSSGIPASPAIILEGSSANAAAGWSVANAGDINGDGYSDIVVGAMNYTNGQTNEGAAFVYYGASAGIASAVPALTLQGDEAFGSFGCSVAGAGDNNGDGYADVVIGGYTSDPSGHVDAGVVRWYRGSATGLNVTYESIITAAGSGTGFSVASAGDVNGDGYADVVFGSLTYQAGALVSAGRASVYYGNPNNLFVQAPPAWHKEGTQSQALLGSAVASAGDVNGDGYSDVIIGQPRYDNGNTDEGRAIVYYGSRGVLASQPQATFSATPFLPVAAGDVNGDGFGDVIAGQPSFVNGQSLEGKAWVFHGTANGISATASFSVEGNQANAMLGYSVASAGDVNSDGYGDVIIGAPGWSNGQNEEGKALIYLGGAGGISSSQTPWAYEPNVANMGIGYRVTPAGDVNGDGFSDVAVGDDDVNAVRVFHGSASGPGSSANWVGTCSDCIVYASDFATAGDVNGDGFDDLAVSDFLYATPGGGVGPEGKVFVYYGGTSGLATSPSWQRESNLNNEYFGWSVATAGDVNGDGFDDVIVGSSPANGRAQVFLGAIGGLSTTAAWQNTSTSGSDYGYKVGSAGDVNGDGYGDVFVAAPEYSGTFSGQGMALVYVGSSGGLGTASWAVLGPGQSNGCGYWINSLGDINADGYSDLGLYCGLVNGVFYGNGVNNTVGAVLRPQAWRSTATSPIAFGGKAHSTTGFLATLRNARGPMGRSRIKLEVEAKAFGSAFNGSGLLTSSTWTDSNVAGTVLTHTVGTSSGPAPHFRMRLVYHPSVAPWAQRSRWIYGGLGSSRAIHVRLL